MGTQQSRLKKYKENLNREDWPLRRQLSVLEDEDKALGIKLKENAHNEKKVRELVDQILLTRKRIQHVHIKRQHLGKVKDSIDNIHNQKVLADTLKDINKELSNPLDLGPIFSDFDSNMKRITTDQTLITTDLSKSTLTPEEEQQMKQDREHMTQQLMDEYGLTLPNPPVNNSNELTEDDEFKRRLEKLVQFSN